MGRRPNCMYERIPSNGLLKPRTVLLYLQSLDTASECAGNAKASPAAEKDIRSFWFVNEKVKYAKHTMMAISAEVHRLISTSQSQEERTKKVPSQTLNRAMSSEPQGASSQGASSKGASSTKPLTGLRKWSSLGNPTNKSFGLAIGFARILAG